MGRAIKFLIQVGRLGAVELRLLSLAQTLGVEVTQIVLPEDYAVGESLISEIFSATALISSAETLAALLQRNSTGLASLDSVASYLECLLIYGLDSCSSESSRVLFGGDILANRSPDSQHPRHRYHLPRGGSAFSLQLAGNSFESETKGNCRSLSVGEHGCEWIITDATTRIIDCDGAPFFAALRRRSSEIFLLATSDLLDVDAPAVTGELSHEAYSALLPWLFFMRRVAGDRCWHNPAPKACLILDDPLLRPNYGFLSFSALVGSMRRNDFKTTIAFIPWNCSRSVANTIELFRHNRSLLSLCVHGCDHTDAEFGVTDADTLRQKARTALERMVFHERATGIDWDRVMVFPQGIFSSASLLALEAEGYLAAVNSRISSVDRREVCRIADLLLPASKAYGGVPLFKRHYPRDILPFALDLFLGKQVLIGEHHTYFRAGYDPVAGFAAQLKAVEPRLTWCPLAHTLRSAVQHRVTASGNELRAYTDEVLFRSPAPGLKQYKLIKHESDPASVSGVNMNGRAVEYQVRDDSVEVQLAVEGECRVDVLRRPPIPFKPRMPSFSSRSKIAARRYLSELRDNVLAGNPHLLPAQVARRFTRAWS